MAPTMSLIILAVAPWSLIHCVTAGVISPSWIPTGSGITTSSHASSSYPGTATLDPSMLLTPAANNFKL
ncbi:hypothetical protein BDV26DRAFT_73079 [Aspergillus bertholletiae]|uniref:Uncharacterized protein n=1 Tax=Aspergillus bertholletiae TaxID=1226010 RepID=A0A5N7ATQ8_9EURO|nr:hypothetical protein BDV26DRAFT_73079 [Aspergillus bertholletiae]